MINRILKNHVGFDSAQYLKSARDFERDLQMHSNSLKKEIMQNESTKSMFIEKIRYKELRKNELGSLKVDNGKEDVKDEVIDDEVEVIDVKGEVINEDDR